MCSVSLHRMSVQSCRWRKKELVFQVISERNLGTPSEMKGNYPMKRNQSILHIDDDVNLLKIVSKKLSLRGYEVHSLDEAKRTSRELVTTGARLVLLDIDMPDIDGLTVLQDIKNHDGGIQVIMLTGLISMNTVLQSMRWGAEACVFKPITEIEPLTSAIDAAFEKIDRWWMSLEELNQRKSGTFETTSASR